MGFGPLHSANARRSSCSHRGVGWSKNAGILAAQILASNDPDLLQKIIDFKEGLKDKVMTASKKMKS